MKSYVLSWVNSGVTTEIMAPSESEAIRRALQLVGDDAVVADNWDTAAPNDNGEPCKRILFWNDAELAENDPGRHAVAQLETVGSP